MFSVFLSETKKARLYFKFSNLVIYLYSIDKIRNNSYNKERGNNKVTTVTIINLQ